MRVAAIGREKVCGLVTGVSFKERVQSAVVRGGRLRGAVCCCLPLAGVIGLAAQILEFTVAVGCIGAVEIAMLCSTLSSSSGTGEGDDRGYRR